MTETDQPSDAALRAGETARIAANIRSALAWKGISARRAGHLLGLSQPAMHRRMSGQTPFDVYDLKMLADMTGISASALILGEPAWLRPPT